ncbi:prepilin-type N-terminal cleavage/methylation domain-containing protein [Candidatus Omnitrophota bacterium]
MFKKTIERRKIKKCWFRQTGFTLIELVVVVVIIGILSSIALPLYNRVVEKSRTAEAYATLGAILSAQKRYVLEHDVYADDLDDLDINITNPGKYFEFGLYTGADAPDPYGGGNNESVAAAGRLPTPYAYGINITELGYFSGSADMP